MLWPSSANSSERTEKITSHDPTAVKRDPEDIKEGVAESKEESKERLRRSGMTKGADKA